MSELTEAYRPGRMIAGRYRITSALSQGGMGAVYLAQQVSLGRDVALKVILERGSDPELIKRFDVEARAVCQLKHPNIITYHDYGRDDDGHPFLVMEYLAGYPGTKLVYGDRRPGLLDLVRVVAQVCSALHEAHQKGIIHRDLKWSNVMICPQSHDPFFAKLIDFGIMKVATDGSSGDQRALTRTGMLLGTPEYMSPEAICGMPIDGRADQYSLAIMMWEALEGHRPFDAASHFELLRQQVQEPPPPFEAAAELMSTYPQVEVVLLQAMEKHPTDRFDDIIAFQQALMIACGLIQAPATAPARPGAKAPIVPIPSRPRPAGTRAIGADAGRYSERAKASGMPDSRTKLPAAAVEAPQPVDTAHKTGRQRAETAPRQLHWAWLVAAFVVFLGIGFGVVMAIIGDKPQPEPKAVASGEVDAAVATKIASIPDAVTTPETQAPETRAPETQEPETQVAALETHGPETVPAAIVAPVADTTEPAKAVDAGPTIAEPEHEKPKVLAPGRLYVQVDPWGNLSIDGRPVGRAPYESEIKAGVHTVTVTNTYFKGAYTFRVKVEPGKRAARTIVLEQHLERVE